MLFAGELLTAHITQDITPVEALAADNVALTLLKKRLISVITSCVVTEI